MSDFDPLAGAREHHRVITDDLASANGLETDGFLRAWTGAPFASVDRALGEIPPELVIDNDDEWGADHGMDHTAVPGVLITNRPLKKSAPSLKDLAAAILAEFGIDEFPVKNAE